MPKSNKLLLRDIGLRINDGMKDKKISAIRLAEKLGITRQAVDNYRNGVSEPPIEKLIQMADLFEVSLDWLLCRDGAVRTTNADIASICRSTGLSEKAVEKLNKINIKNFASGRMDACNSLIEHSDFEYLLALVDAYVFYDDDPVMPGGENVMIGEASICITKHAVIKAELYSLIIEILADIEKASKKDTEEAKEKVIKRVFGKMARSLYDEGKLTLDQLNETLTEYQRGNFDYSPLRQKEGEKHGKHPETNE